MFCSRRKSPSAPCSCAYRLRGSLPELLNHLCCLGRTTMVLRQQSLSLAKSTAFGLSIASRDGEWRILRDRLSGLETDTSRPRHLYLFTDAADHRPVIGMADAGQPLHLTVRLDCRVWDSPVVGNLIRCFDGIALDCVESRRLGAGAWLDEWERPVPRRAASVVEDACRQLRGCRELEVSVRNRGHRGVACFEPSFVDFSGTVLRIADRACRHVVHADAADPDFRIAGDEPSSLRLSVGAAVI